MERRPLPVSLIAGYFWVFSGVLLAILLWQVAAHRIHGGFAETAIVLSGCFLLALLPGVLGVGLWLLDNAARVAAVMFALLHAISEIAFLSSVHVPPRTFTWFRIFLDGAIILCLVHPGIRGAFRWKPVELSIPK
ncbi:MAG TPA: hypothetical protein VE783_06410 [Candidatus Limnocylindrales bacterium]|jgi:hypothetical protein|nr:hypothetical protein [Candidatus Limnocylindrales bacterium]